MNQEVIDLIRTLVGSNDIKDAIEILSEALPSKSDRIILITRDFNDLNGNPTITNEERRAKMSQIGSLILNLINSSTSSDSVYNPIHRKDLNELIGTLKRIQKPYYYISIVLIILGVGCLIYFGIGSDFSPIEILTSGLFTLCSGVPLGVALKKRNDIERANFFMRITPPPSENIQEAYRGFINKF